MVIRLDLSSASEEELRKEYERIKLGGRKKKKKRKVGSKVKKKEKENKEPEVIIDL